MQQPASFLLVPLLCAFASASLAQAVHDDPVEALPSLLEHRDVVALRKDPEGHDEDRPAAGH